MKLTFIKQQKKFSFQTGAVFVEFLFVLILLLLPMIYLTIEASRAISEYKALVNQVRAAARYLSTMNAGEGHLRAACFLKTGVISCSSGTPLIMPGYANLNIKITDSRLQTLNGANTNINPTDTHRFQQTSTSTDPFGSVVNLVTVEVTGYEYTLITSFLENFSSISFGPISATMRQVSG